MRNTYAIITIMVLRRKTGKIIITHGIIVWHHELITADALSGAGYEVEFLHAKSTEYSKSPDILMDGNEWEIKSPTASKLSAVERNLKKAYKQSNNIIFDSHRMGRLPDKSIQKELVKQFKLTKNIERIIFVNRKRQIVDIRKLI